MAIHPSTHPSICLRGPCAQALCLDPRHDAAWTRKADSFLPSLPNDCEVRAARVLTDVLFLPQHTFQRRAVACPRLHSNLVEKLGLTARPVAPRPCVLASCPAEVPLPANSSLAQPCLLAYFDVFLGFAGVPCSLCPERHPKMPAGSVCWSPAGAECGCAAPRDDSLSGTPDWLGPRVQSL